MYDMLWHLCVDLASTSLMRLKSVDAENLPDLTNSATVDGKMCFI